MSIVMRWIFLAALFSPLAAQTRQAELILMRLDRVAWDTPYAAYHAAPGETCQLAPPHTSLRHGLYDYAYHCQSTADGVVAESFFYPTEDESPRIVLRRVDFHLAGADSDRGEAVEQLIRTRLAVEHGEGEVPDGLFEIGANRPNPGLSWKFGDLTLFLHHNRMAVAPSGIRTGVELIAVRREVLDLRERWRKVDDAIRPPTAEEPAVLAREWQESPDTERGQRAFLTMQELACTAGLPEPCPGPSCFRMIIREGEQFLRAYPQSPFRRQQLYHLALAYETWWSLSQARPDDPTAEGADVDQAEGDNARRLALSLYAQVIRMAPESPEGRSATLRLPRLKLSLDTGERAYFCFSC